MITMLKPGVVAATVLVALMGASPAFAGDWFGVQISNHGLSLGFGSTNWSIWGSSWSRHAWSVDLSTSLAGYGEWVWIDGLGRVWQPWVATGWRPFTHGRWVWTSLGWTWVSYEPWGWVPHHYGNWAFTTVGWVWSPGYSYHPGNVVWIGSGAYVGWYPCAPRGWSHAHRAYHRGRNHGYSNGHRDGYQLGYAEGWSDARHATWVPWRSFGADNAAIHAVEYREATRAVPRASLTARALPPTRAEVERRGGRAVPEARLVERSATIDGRNVRIVRPEGQAHTVERQAEATVRRALTPPARDRVTNTTHTIRDESRALGSTARSQRTSAHTLRSDRSANRPVAPINTGSSPSSRGTSATAGRTRTVDRPARSHSEPDHSTSGRRTQGGGSVRINLSNATPTGGESTTRNERNTSRQSTSDRPSRDAGRRRGRSKG